MVLDLITSILASAVKDISEYFLEKFALLPYIFVLVKILCVFNR